MVVLVERCRLRSRQIRIFKPRPYRCVKFFGMNRKSLILSSQEKFLSLVIVARTVNRHRWVG